MELDVVWLSRIQFALTVMFHYLFPPLTIGLGVLMVVMEGMYLRTGQLIYETMARFWTRIFAVNFAMGVISGIVMEFQFGTNWANYSRYVGDVFGSALAAEGVFAFFLESGFLALLVYGWDRVSPRVHFFATVMVSLGSMFSAIWILVANSWMQTPAGYHIVEHEGYPRAEITDFWALVFNPSSLPRLWHTLMGAYILGSFFVMSISAYYLLKGRHVEFARKSFKLALIAGLVYIVVLMPSAHLMALTVAEHQPAKLAAMEGHFKTGDGPTGMVMFGFPDAEAGEMRGAVMVPGLLSLLVHGDFQTPVTGLDKFAPEDRPPVGITFYMYHVMLGLAGVFVVLYALAGFYLWRGSLFEKRWLLWTFVFAVVLPFVANQSGWITAEVGRQPWIVYNLMRTSEGVSPTVPGDQVLGSIVMFSLIYLVLFGVWIYVLHNKIMHGPGPDRTPPRETTREGLLEAAGERLAPTGHELTDKSVAAGGNQGGR